jgi:hypothetical protein
MTAMASRSGHQRRSLPARGSPIAAVAAVQPIAATARGKPPSASDGSHPGNPASAKRIRADRVRRRGRLRRAGGLAGALAGLALLAACSGPPPPAGSPGSLPAGSPRYQKALAYAQCMRSHGIANFPDPNNQGDFILGNTVINGVSHGVNQNSPQYLSANTTCQKLLPGGGQLTPAQEQRMMTAALRLAQCIRSHGIPNFPDPTQNGSSGGSFPLNGSGIDPARVRPAMQTCMKLTHFSQGAR